MKKSCLILTPEGVVALSHLASLFFRNGNAIDCLDVEPGGNYLDVKLVAQREPFSSLPPCHVLIPHRYIDLIVIDQPARVIGFTPS
jgi:hypothetical protein